MDMVVMACWLDMMILVVFPNLNDSMILNWPVAIELDSE